MAVELPDVIEDPGIMLEEGIPFHYAAWGIRWRYKGIDEWRVVDMPFLKKSVAVDWMNRNYKKEEGFEAEVIPIERIVWEDLNGNIQSETKELTE